VAQTKAAQLAASRRDYAKNKVARRKAAYRRQARLFIRSHADMGDIEELRTLIDKREEELKS
jgi:hypothetical protein